MAGPAQRKTQPVHDHQSRARGARTQLVNVGRKIGAVVLALAHLSHVRQSGHLLQDFVERLAALFLDVLLADRNQVGATG